MLLLALIAFAVPLGFSLRDRVDEEVKLQAQNQADIGDVESACEELDGSLVEVDRLSHIVDELLLLSRAGAPDAPADQIDLGETASDAVERWSGAAERNGIELTVGSDRPAVVMCARPDIDRGLDSLVENAVQYSPAGSSVLVRACGRVIEVLDEGPGSAGTGLGLPIARALLRRWDAVTTIANRRDGGGARARIEFAPEENS